MTIQYTAAPAFRNTYFDDQGVPLIDGKIYSFEATSHITPKAIYTSNIITPPETTPPAYSNPIDLDSGASVGPLFFASDSNYYLVLTDKDDDEIATVDNWNAPENENPQPGGDEVDITNFFTNHDFTQQYRKSYDKNALLSGSQIPIAPPNWFYERSNDTADVNIEFKEFALGQTEVPDNPFAYVKYTCTSAGSGETSSDIGYSIIDVRTFSDEPVIIDIHGLSSTNKTIEVLAYQFFGIGGSSPITTSIGTIILTDTWASYNVTATIPSISGKIIGTGERGRLDIIFRMPLNTASDVSLSHFQINRGTQLLEYQYEPDYYASGRNLIVGAPPAPYTRAFEYSRKVLASDGNGGLLWEHNTRPGVIMLWPTEIFPPGCFELNGDWLPKWAFMDLWNVLGERYGRYFATASVLTNIVTVTGNANGNVTDASDVSTGFTVTVTQQGTGAVPEIFTIATLGASSITPGSYLTFSTIEGGVVNWALWISIDYSGTPPVTPGAQQIRLDLNSTDDANTVAAKLETILNPLAFLLPDWRGFVPRVWDHGAGRDPDAATRTARPDGVSGDNPGTTQVDENKAHTHLATTTIHAENNNPGLPQSNPTGNHFGHTTAGAKTYQSPPYVFKVSMAADTAATVIASEGGESRPINIYAAYIIQS